MVQRKRTIKFSVPNNIPGVLFHKPNSMIQPRDSESAAWSMTWEFAYFTNTFEYLMPEVSESHLQNCAKECVDGRGRQSKTICVPGQAVYKGEWFLRLIFWSVPMFYGLSPRKVGMRDGALSISRHLEKILPCRLTFRITMTECGAESFEGWGGSRSPHISINRPAFRPWGTDTMWLLHQQQERVLSGPTEAHSLMLWLLGLSEKKGKDQSSAMLTEMLSEALWRLPWQGRVFCFFFFNLGSCN